MDNTPQENAILDVKKKPFGQRLLDMIEAKSIKLDQNWAKNNQDNLLIDVAIELEFDVIYP